MAELKTYKIKAPDGSMLNIQGPVDASPEDVIKNAEILFNQKQQASQQPKYNMAAESARSLAQGVTFGSADEIEAGLRAAPTVLKAEMAQGGLAGQIPTDQKNVSLSDQMMGGLSVPTQQTAPITTDRITFQKS